LQLDARGYDNSIFHGIDGCELFSVDDWATVERQVESVCALLPQVVVISGWMLPAYERLLAEPRLSHAKFIMALDNPWTGSWKQRISRFRRRSFLRRVSMVVTGGERSRWFAESLGIPSSRIRVGAYCCDYDAFAPAMEHRLALPRWPRKFLFVGRMDPVKGIDELLEGYRMYRATAESPWTLSMCGLGPLDGRARGAVGVDPLGFVQPKNLPSVMADHGAFIIASRKEPWGVAIAEACAAGLPIACSDQCGAGIDLVRDWSNGFIFPAWSAAGVRDAMLGIHANEARLSDMGKLSQRLAVPYSAAHWARRWGRYLREVVGLPC
jgi:glycosyltransferase involved in cell wall biosynthesis